MTSTSTTPNFETLYTLLRARTGLSVSDTKRDNVAAAIQGMLDSLKLPSPQALAVRLEQEAADHVLWQELIDIVTVGETYFFRNLDQFTALRTEVLPAIIERRRRAGSKQLRLWSAGCATGEEPYSLAILLRELLPDIDDWQIALLATDLNTTSLERARRGLYRSWSFRNETPDDVRTRWFAPEADGYRLAPAIRGMVAFLPLNLVSDHYPSFESGTMHMDVIMCRNVTIYFDQDTTREIVRRLYQALTDDGWLVVGHAEPMASIYNGFEPRNFPNTVLYQKTSPAEDKLPALEPFPVAPPILPVVIPPPLLIETRRLPQAPTGRTQPEPAPVQPLEITVDDSWDKAKEAADQENWNDALVWLARAEHEDKFQPQVYHLRAVIQLHLGDTEGALISLRQAIYCDPTFTLAHYTLGEVHEQQGDFKSAVRHWQIAQTTIRALDPKEQMPFAQELTVEMLQGLLAHGLNRLANGLM